MAENLAETVEQIEKSQSLELQGKISAAFALAQSALEAALETGQPGMVSRARMRLAAVHYRLGHDEQARCLAEQVLGQPPLPDTPSAIARVEALLMLGMCLDCPDYVGGREELYHQAIDLSRQAGYCLGLLRGLHNLAAGVYLPRGQFDLALAADAEALHVARSQDLKDYAWWPLTTMSWIYWLTGQRIQAAVSARELAELAQPGSMGAAYAGCIRANLGLDDGNFEEARRLFSEARSAAEAIGAPDLNVYVRLGLSRLQRQCGNFSEAAQWAEDARKLAGRVDYPQLAGQSLIELARAAWASGDEAGAAAYLVQACAALEPIQANFDLCRARLYLAALPGPNSPADAWTEALSGILEHDYIFLAYQERRLVYPLLAASLESNDFRLSQASAALVEQMQRVPPEPLRIVTLGGLAVWQAGRAIPRAELARRRAGELLALLIVSPGRCLSYDQVGEALGPEQDFEWAKMTFQHATSSLRHALEPELPDRRFPSHYLEVNEGQVRLALPPGSRLDLDAFQEAYSQKRWQDAFALYTGDLFPEFIYADWAAAAREGLNRDFQRVLLALAEAELGAGHPAAALRHVERLLGADPWQEMAALIGMRACVEMKEPAQALRLYHRVESSLRQELGLEPQKELQDFFKLLSSGR